MGISEFQTHREPNKNWNCPYFSFRDSEEFLRYSLALLKQREPGISHRYISQFLGFKSSATFGLIIKAEILPDVNTLDRLAVLFNLNKSQRIHLALLFEIKRSKDPDIKKILLELIENKY